MPHYVVCLAHFCEIHGPSTILCTQKQVGELTLSSSTLSLCESCSLQLPNGATNIVTDVNLEKYTSTRYPSTQRLYTSLMKLVMKCLSVEAVADPLKPIFYGDATNGFCLSRVFSIADIHARGGERKYAFLVVCDSETQLIGSWDFVSAYITEMASYLQRQVEHKVQEAKSNFVDNERYLRRQKNMPKNLADLTGDADVFQKLHLCGIELIRDVNIG